MARRTKSSKARPAQGNNSLRRQVVRTFQRIKPSTGTLGPRKA